MEPWRREPLEKERGEKAGMDPRTYGCSSLSMAVTQSGGFEVRKEPGKRVHVRRKDAKRKVVR